MYHKASIQIAGARPALNLDPDAILSMSSVSKDPKVYQLTISDETEDAAADEKTQSGGHILDGSWLCSDIQGFVTEDTPAELKDEMHAGNCCTASGFLL